MTEQTQNSDDLTRPGALNPAHWSLQQRMAREVAKKKRENPDYFDETTAVVLGPEDILEPTTVVQEADPGMSEPTTLAFSAKEKDQELTKVDGDRPDKLVSTVSPEEDITFLHPKDVHTLIEQQPGKEKSEIDAVGHTQLSPSDVVSEIENRVQKASSESPSIEYRYQTSPSSQEFASGQENKNPAYSTEILESPLQVAATTTILPNQLSSIMEMSREEFLGKERLESADAYRLLELIRRDPEDPEIIAFTKKIAPTELDYEIFWANIRYLSVQFIQAVLGTGGYQEIYLDMEKGHQKTVVLYSGSTLQKSGMGHVFYAQMADSDFKELQLVLVKIPLEKELELETDVNKAVFQDEIQVSRQFRKIARERPDDPRLKHLLLPKYQGSGFLVMPLIRNSSGRSIDLSDIAGEEANTVQDWARCLAGAARGVSLATECGLINADLKPANIMDGSSGGVLIDWGGFIERAAFERGEISIRTNSIAGNLYPLVENGLKTMKDEEYWELNNGNIQRTPGYINIHLLAQELMGQMPPGTVHKFSFYRILERYFLLKKKAKRKTREFMSLNEMEKLNYPILKIPATQLNPAEQLLYELYLKLHQSHHHPYRFKDNNPSHGIDRDYISMEEIIVRLDEIANLNTQNA